MPVYKTVRIDTVKDTERCVEKKAAAYSGSPLVILLWNTCVIFLERF